MQRGKGLGPRNQARGDRLFEMNRTIHRGKAGLHSIYVSDGMGRRVICIPIEIKEGESFPEPGERKRNSPKRKREK